MIIYVGGNGAPEERNIVEKVYKSILLSREGKRAH